MGERVDQRDHARGGAEFAPLRHRARRKEKWAVGPCRAGRQDRDADRHRAGLPLRRQGAAQHYLCRRVGRGEDRGSGGSERLRRLGQSAFAAFSTSATWPGTLTLCQTPRTVPLLSIRKVLRSMPMYLRPYMLFSIQTPYFSTTSPVPSEASMKGSWYLALNLSCDLTESLEMPITVAPVAP